MVNNVDKWKQRLIDVFDGLEQSVIDYSVAEWRKHHRARV